MLSLAECVGEDDETRYADAIVFLCHTFGDSSDEGCDPDLVSECIRFGDIMYGRDAMDAALVVLQQPRM
jgi:hypothetical protein